MGKLKINVEYDCRLKLDLQVNVANDVVDLINHAILDILEQAMRHEEIPLVPLKGGIPPASNEGRRE